MTHSAAERIERERWRFLAFMSLSLVLAMSTWFSASAVIPQLRSEWGLSSTSAAWLTIAVQLGFVGGAVVSSLINLSDIAPPRYVIMGSALGAAAVNAGLALADGPVVGILLRFATGFFLAGVYPPALKLASTWFRARRGLALGILGMAIVVGNGVPHLVNGLGGLEWQLVIGATSVQSLLSGLIAGFVLRDGPYPFPSAVFDVKQIGLALRNRGVRLASLGYVAHMWELFALYAWVLVFFNEVLDIHQVGTASTAAYAVFGIFVAGGIGSFLGGVIADRWGRENAAMVMLIFSGSCALLIGFVYEASLALTAFIALVWGVSVVGDSLQFSTLVTEKADQSYVGTALTVQLAAGFAVTSITIWLIPIVQEWAGWRWAFTFLVPGPLVGIWAMLRLKATPQPPQV